MQINGKTIVLTGAAGGIGSAISRDLHAAGARLVLIDLDQEKLDELNQSLGGKHRCVAADLTQPEQIKQVLDECSDLPDPPDILVNGAGLADFGLLDDQSPEQIRRLLDINLTAPILLAHGLVELLRQRPEAAIVNMGSTFGSIGYPAYSTYCASKFGLRGFSEALRRELSDTSVRVLYLAPRATRTPINNESVMSMNAELGNAVDEPAVVASALVRLLQSSRPKERFIGWPEKLFVRINGLLPRVVDNSLRKQLPIIRRHAGHQAP